MNKFIKALSLINVVLLSFTLSSCGTLSNTDYKEKYTSFKALNQNEKVEKMEKEVKYICENLEKKHINLYHSISKEEFKEKEDELIDELPNIENESQYYFALSELITTLKDAHTRVGNNDLVVKDSKLYGFNVDKFENSWILTGIGEGDKDKLGYEVKSINNVDINEIYNRTMNISPHENSYVLVNYFPSYIKVAELLKKIKVLDSADEDELSLTLTDSNGNDVNIKVPSVEYNDISGLISLSSKVEPMETEYLETINYWNEKFSDDVYYIQYNQCAESPTLKMSKFTDQVSNDIKNNEFKKVIIDLRYNGGGNSEIIQPLYDELKKIKDNKKFKVYILIGNKTFSSALLNANDAKEKLDAVLVGQPTGGNLNAYGEVKSFDLPYSGFRIDYCTKYFELAKGYDKDALYPDIESSIKIKDYINGVDTDVQTVIDDEV